MHAYRSHTCADLTAANVGDTVRLSGWVHRVRDHGGVLFIDLRDHYGMTQVLCDPDSPVFAEMEKVRSEWCIRIDGNVKARDASLVNDKIPTGEIEVFVRDVEVLGSAAELPLMVFGDQEYPEETRLKYRFLDLRREQMQRNMVLRSDVVSSIRQRMWDRKFKEFQTPIITASSPEGARDFLVPSRLHPARPRDVVCHPARRVRHDPAGDPRHLRRVRQGPQSGHRVGTDQLPRRGALVRL